MRRKAARNAILQEAQLGEEQHKKGNQMSDTTVFAIRMPTILRDSLRERGLLEKSPSSAIARGLLASAFNITLPPIPTRARYATREEAIAAVKEKALARRILLKELLVKYRQEQGNQK